MRVSIIIPTYNERENLPLLVEKLSEILEENFVDGEIVIVDDNSPDGTGEIAEKLKEKYKMQVLHRKAKLGLSSAVLDGAKIAKGDIIGVMDADLSHPPEEIPKFLRAIKEADFVIGSRYKKGGKIENWDLKRKIVSKGAKFLAKPLTSVTDPLSGFFFFRKKLLEGIKLNPKGFKIGLEILVKAKPKKIVEIPYTFVGRKKGKSKLNLKEYSNYLHHLLSLYFFKFLKFAK
jgi:dolichol-phosphate mannosyltransferase